MKSFNLHQAVIAALISGALALVSPIVFAQESEDAFMGYVGVSAGLFDEDLPANFTSDESAGVGRLYIGVRYKNGTAFEVALNRFGDLILTDDNGRTQTVERSALSFNVIGRHLRLHERFGIFWKVGLGLAQVDAGNEAHVRYSDDSTYTASYGLGAEWRIADDFAFRAEIDEGTSGLSAENYAWSIGIVSFF